MKKGFTLVELLAVVIIIAVLSSVAMPQYRRSLERSRVAEALELLPAIYDAQQRYYVEAEIAPNIVSFPKLDINLRGKVAGTSQNQWKTGNFTYTIGPRLAMMNLFQRPTAPVYATVTKGKYQGAEIFYDGEEFFCCNKTATGACAAFAINVNSFYCNTAEAISTIDAGDEASWNAVDHHGAPVEGPAQGKF